MWVEMSQDLTVQTRPNPNITRLCRTTRELFNENVSKEMDLALNFGGKIDPEKFYSRFPNMRKEVVQARILERVVKAVIEETAANHDQEPRFADPPRYAHDVFPLTSPKFRAHVRSNVIGIVSRKISGLRIDKEIDLQLSCAILLRLSETAINDETDIDDLADDSQEFVNSLKQQTPDIQETVDD
ncbi:MAG: hypothetical protein KGH60_01055 [Candidatus Micrarchaeota archaeon]|nr:hypothetical protein [Candidatus Micrarchaeota archaeon]